MSRGGKVVAVIVGLVISGMAAGVVGMQARGPVTPADSSTSSDMSVNEEDFRAVFQRMSAAKAEVMKRHTDLLNARYDLADRPAAGVTMSGGKPLQDGVRVKRPPAVTWEALGAMSADDMRDKGLSPTGSCRSFRRRYI